MKTHITIILMTAAVFAGTIFLIVDYHRATEDEVIRRFHAQQLHGVRHLVHEMDQYLRDRSQGAQVLSTFASVQHRDMKKMAADIQEYFQYVKKDYVKAISMYDEKGTIIYSTTEDAIGRNYANCDFSQWAAKKENKGKLFISSLIRAAKNQSDRPPYFRFVIAAPVYQEARDSRYPKPTHKFAGVLTVTIDLEEVIAAFLPLISNNTTKQHVWIVDTSGTVLFQSEHPEMVLNSIRRRDETCMRCHVSLDYVEKVLAEKQGRIEYALKERPKKLACFAPLTFENAAWIIAVNVPLEEVSGFLQRQLVQTFLLVGLITVAFVGAAALIYRSNRSKIRAQEEAKQWREKRELEEKIRQSEERYRTIVESAHDIIWTMDTQGNFTFINGRGEELTGHKISDLIGKSFAPLIYPEDLPEVQEVFLRTLKGTPQSYDVRVSDIKGKIIVLSVNTVPIYQDDTVVGTFSFGRDITERKLAEEELRRRNQELSVLHTIDRAVNKTLDLDQILNVAIEKTMEVLDADSGGIYLLQEDGKTMLFVVHRGLSDEFVKNVEKIQLGEGISGRAAAERKPVIMDIPHYPSKRLAPFIIKEGVQSIVSVPLLAKNKVLGAINVGSRNPDAFPENKIDTLLSIGIQIGVAVQNAELFKAEQRKTAQLLAITTVSQNIAALLDVEKLLPLVVKLIQETFGYAYVTLAVVDEKANEIVYNVAAGYDVAELKEPHQKLGAVGIIPSVALSGQSLLANDVSTEPRFQFCDVLKDTRSELAVPIVVRNKVVAVLDIQSDKLNAFSPDDLTTFKTVAGDIGIAIENTRLYEDLRGTTNYLENLITYANAPIIVWNPKRKITLFNRAFEKLSGYRSDEVIGCDLEMLFPAAEKEEILKTIDQTIKGERWETVEIPIQRKDGEQHIALWNSASIKDKEGEIIATIAQGQDITERKRAEETLRESEKKYRDIVENTLVGVYRTNLKGNILYVNEATWRMFEFDSAEEMISGGAVVRYKNPKDRDVLIDKLTRTGIINSFQFDALTNTGKTKTLLLSATLTGDMLAGMVIDITERKRAEQERQVLYAIGETVNTTASLDELLQIIHHNIKKVIYAENCYIATYDASTETMSFPFFVDQFDPPPLPRARRRGLTEYVSRTAKPLLLTRELLDELVRNNEVEIIGTLPESWLGVPLFIQSKPIGVLVVQSYEPGQKYADREKSLLVAIGNQTSVAIERKLAEEASRRTEEEIKKRKEYLETLMSSSLDLIFTVGKDGIFDFANKRLEDILGYSFDDIKGKPLWDFIPKEMHPFMQEKWTEVQKGIASTYETEVIRKDGSVAHCLVSHSKLEGLDEYLAILKDISERKLAEEALRKHDDRYKKVIENIFKFVPEGILVFTGKLKLFNRNKTFDDVVRTYSSKLGYTEQGLAEIIIEEVKRRLTGEISTTIRIPKKKHEQRENRTDHSIKNP